MNLPLGVLALFVLAATLPAAAERVHHTIDYLGTVAAGGGAERDRAGGVARRHLLRVGLADDRRAGDRRGAGAGGLPRVRAPRARAGAAAAAAEQPRVRGDQRRRLRRRLRAVRRGHLPAAVPAGRQGREPDRLGAAAGAADGRPAGHLDRLGAGDHAHRPLQGVPDRGHGGDDARASTCSRRWTRRAAAGDDLRVHVRARAGARDGDAGARAGRAERGRLLRPRRGDLGRDAVSLDRRLARHGGARRDLLQPPARRARERCCRPARRRTRAPAARSTQSRSRTCHRRCTPATCTRSPAR